MSKLETKTKLPPGQAPVPLRSPDYRLVGVHIELFPHEPRNYATVHFQYYDQYENDKYSKYEMSVARAANLFGRLHRRFAEHQKWSDREEYWSVKVEADTNYFLSIEMNVYVHPNPWE